MVRVLNYNIKKEYKENANMFKTKKQRLAEEKRSYKRRRGR
jgi:hypothetical protein